MISHWKIKWLLEEVSLRKVSQASVLVSGVGRCLTPTLVADGETLRKDGARGDVRPFTGLESRVWRRQTRRRGT